MIEKKYFGLPGVLDGVFFVGLAGAASFLSPVGDAVVLFMKFHNKTQNYFIFKSIILENLKINLLYQDIKMATWHKSKNLILTFIFHSFQMKFFFIFH